MFKKIGNMKWLGIDSQSSLEVILGLAVAIIGVYIAGPWYLGGTDTPVSIGLGGAIPQFIAGAIYALSGVVTVWGAITHHRLLRHWGTFLVFCCFIFMMLLRLLAVGWLPVVWIPMLACALISGVCHIRVSRGDSV